MSSPPEDPTLAPALSPSDVGAEDEQNMDQDEEAQDGVEEPNEGQQGLNEYAIVSSSSLLKW